MKLYTSSYAGYGGYTLYLAENCYLFGSGLEEVYRTYFLSMLAVV